MEISRGQREKSACIQQGKRMHGQVLHRSREDQSLPHISPAAEDVTRPPCELCGGYSISHDKLTATRDDVDFFASFLDEQ